MFLVRVLKRIRCRHLGGKPVGNVLAELGLDVAWSYLHRVLQYFYFPERSYTRDLLGLHGGAKVDEGSAYLEEARLERRVAGLDDLDGFSNFD